MNRLFAALMLFAAPSCDLTVNANGDAGTGGGMGGGREQIYGPMRLTADPAFQKVKLTWEPVFGATHYTVYVAAGSFGQAWSASLPEARSFPSTACCTITIDNLATRREYTFGVSASTPNGESYTAQVKATAPPVALNWARRAPMPTPRFDFGAAAVGNKIYAVGGNSGSLLRAVEEYDPAANGWRAVTPMPTARDNLAVVAVNGKLYALGGVYTSDPNEDLSTANEEYDPLTDLWVVKAPIPRVGTFGRTCRRTAGATSGGKIYVWQGMCASPNQEKVQEYDPISNTWAARGPFASGGIEWPLFTTIAGQVWAMVEGAMPTFVQYQLSTDTWIVKPTITTDDVYSQDVAWWTLTGASQGMYTFGTHNIGYSNLPTWRTQTRWFDVSTSKWLLTTGMTVPRSSFTSVGLGNAVYVLGGTEPRTSYSSTPVPLDTVEVGFEEY